MVWREMKRAPSWIALLSAALVMGCASGELGDDDDDTTIVGDTSVAQDTSTADTDGGDTSTTDTSTSDTSTTDTSTSDTSTTDTSTGDTSTGDTAQDTTQDVGPNDSVLGDACGATSTCAPGSGSWPSCTLVQCDGETCVLNLDTQGFCTNSCSSDTDCATASTDSIVGSGFSCVEGRCMPGTQSACDNDGDCSGGEVCKISVTTGGSLGTVCQTATAGGAAPGETCNSDPDAGAVVRCANDFCNSGLCSGFCDETDSGSCGTNLSCQTEVELTTSLVRSVCLGNQCTSDADCTQGWHCQPSVFTEGTESFLAGRCVAGSTEANAQPVGAACTEDADCITNYCETRSGASPFCSVACDANTDCTAGGGEGICAGLRLNFESTNYVIPVCQKLHGAGTACDSLNDCIGDDVCTPYLKVENSLRNNTIIVASVENYCVTSENTSGATLGQTCSPGDCKSGLCVNNGTISYCSGPCQLTTHCSADPDMVCQIAVSLFDQNTADLNDDVLVSACVK